MATFCYCNGAQYTIIIERNTGDPCNNPIHVYRPSRYDDTLIEVMPTFNAERFHFKKFNSTYIEMHKKFPILLVAIQNYGIIGVDLATKSIILDLDL